MTHPQPGRTFRTRLALLYACLFLTTGVVLLVIADLPLLTFGQTGQAGHSRQASVPALTAPVRSTSNLPEVLLYSGLALAGLAVASVALGWLVADRALRPLRTITAAARAISASSLDERLSLGDSYEEFRELGDTLDSLFARLEASFDTQRHFIANAAHELRSPLAAERTVIEVALADPYASSESLRSACEQALALGEQQEHLINALLTLAIGQRELQKREAVDLAEMTSRILASRNHEAASRGHQAATSLAPAVAAGDPDLIESLVTNLVDNAIRHNVSGGRIEIATATDAGSASLEISNTGPVIPPGEIDRLFQPFQQLNGERTGHEGGHGLGLAVVAAIARAHGASLSARARPEGGLDITVSFPAAGEHAVPPLAGHKSW